MGEFHTTPRAYNRFNRELCLSITQEQTQLKRVPQVVADFGDNTREDGMVERSLEDINPTSLADRIRVVSGCTRTATQPVEGSQTPQQ